MGSEHYGTTSQMAVCRTRARSPVPHSLRCAEHCMKCKLSQKKSKDILTNRK